MRGGEGAGDTHPSSSFFAPGIASPCATQNDFARDLSASIILVAIMPHAAARGSSSADPNVAPISLDAPDKSLCAFQGLSALVIGCTRQMHS